MPTLAEVLSALARRLNAAGVPSPTVDAERLAQHALGLTHTDLFLKRGQLVEGAGLEQLEGLARRREVREPLQHLLGSVEWGGLHLRVSPAALIPRPETEVLLDLALGAIEKVGTPSVIDVGTGTGALALGIKRARPDARVWATDLSGEALELAEENALALGLDVTFALGDLNASICGPFDLVVSNPPYLPAADALEAQPEVSHDPALALYSGPDGLEVARRLVGVAVQVLRPAGVLALELDPRNVRVLSAELEGWQVEVHPDLTGRERFLTARRP